jgi:hypothetical protein
MVDPGAPETCTRKQPAKAVLLKKDESAAHSIQARRSLLQQRPDTFAQTNTPFPFFACNTAADHTFRVARHLGATVNIPGTTNRPRFNLPDSLAFRSGSKRVAQNQRRRGGSSRSLGRIATLMSRCSLRRNQFAAGDGVAGTNGNRRTLFTSRVSERQESWIAPSPGFISRQLPC